MKQELLIAENVTKKFKGSTACVLQHIDVTVYDGDFTVIMGASGAGKSTLLYGLSGMNHIDEGSIRFQNQIISEYNEQQMAVLRSHSFGFVFQQANLINNLTLFENVGVAGYVNKHHTSKEIDERATMLLKRMHIDHAMHRYPSQISGGEAQRAAIARAMINEPTLLFADEPTGALNRNHSDEVLKILSELHQNGQSILMVTHDVRAAACGNRLLYMEDGAILHELDLSLTKEISQKQKEAKVNDWLSALLW